MGLPLPPETISELVPSPPPRKMRMRLIVLATLGILLFGGIFTLGTIPRIQKAKAVQSQIESSRSILPRVTVRKVRQVANAEERLFPGNCLPLMETAIFPRSSGYVKKLHVDIGDRVKQGALLAEISAPEMEAVLLQAKATLLQNKADLTRAQADEAYAKSEEKRQHKLLQTTAVSREDYEKAVNAVAVATATVRASEAGIKVTEANITRLETLLSFSKVRAPFDGVITARNIDLGDLVHGDTPGTGKEILHLMKTDIVRVWVNVPQAFSIAVKNGQLATVWRSENSSRTYSGKVTRTADALDPNTRTLLTEIEVPNPDNTLRSGMYLQVKFTFARESFPVTIPTAAVITRRDGPRVAILDSNQSIRYRSIQLGRDYGAEVEVGSGLKDGEMVVVYPGDDLPEGTIVDPEIKSDN